MKALVLFSGGIDSTTALGLAIQNMERPGDCLSVSTDKT